MTRCILLVIGSLAAGVTCAQSVKTDTVILRFAFNQSGIRAADSASLRLFVRDRLRSDGTILDSIAVTGYTDTVGSLDYNQRLSLRRAMAAVAVVRQWLGEDSFLVKRIEARGELEPLGDDSESRRVAIVCWQHASPPPPPVIVRLDTPKSSSEPDTILRLDDIRFYANTTNLTESAQVILPKHLDYLLTLKDRFLEIDGYCNSPGPPLKTSDPLYILSEKRARFIYDRLVEKGFDTSRVIYKGKGNANPRNAHPTTRDEMDKNMRVEIQVFRSRPEER